MQAFCEPWIIESFPLHWSLINHLKDHNQAGQAGLWCARHNCYNNILVYVRPSIRIWQDHNFCNCGWISNKLTHLFSIRCRCVIWNIHSGTPKVKVTLQGQIFVCPINPTILDGHHYWFAQLFPIMSRCAIWRFHLCRSKVKVMWARWVVPGQPSSSDEILSQLGQLTVLINIRLNKICCFILD